MALEEADTESDPHHADHVVGADVGAVDRAGNSPPGDGLSGQEVVFGRLFLAAGNEADGHDADQRREEQDNVQRLKDVTHTHEVSSRNANR